MNKLFLTITLITFFAFAASAQSLNVNCGSVSYNFPAEDAGDMTFASGTEVTVLGRTFEIGTISSMLVTEDIIDENVVEINYDGTSANVAIAGNIAKYIDVTISGADVIVYQSDLVGDDTCGEITYRLRGQSLDGSFSINGQYKISLEFLGLSLTSNKGAAIDIQNGKRTAIRVAEGTVNTLSDATGGSQKGCISCKGHLEFKQKGTLIVNGNAAHAIYAKEYIQIKNTKIIVAGAIKDGVNCNQYLLMESGSLTISGSGDDGIQVAFKDDTDREAEDTGTITVSGGTLNISVTANGAKALKADGDIIINDGEITALTSGGGIWDSSKSKTKASSCLGADGSITINGGTLTLTSTGGGGKGISCDGPLTVNEGTITITTTGGMFAYVNGVENQNYTGNADNLNSDYKSSPKGIKCDSDVTINGGTFDIITKGKGGEGIESKAELHINGGNIKIRAYDDGTNSTSHTYITGGTMEIISSVGDAIDSNADIYVSGGNFSVYGARSPEQGFDAGDGHAIYFTGGTFMAVGGGNSAPSKSTSTQAYVVLSKGVAAGNVVGLYSGSTLLAEFTVPTEYTSTSGSSGGRPGGSGSGSLLMSCPGLVSGTSYTVKIGTTSTNATARLTGGSSGPGGGW